MDIVKDLQRFAQQRCAISIQTINNPGWMVTITPRKPLADALRVEGDPPRAANNNMGGASWLVCKVERGAFTGAGDFTRLTDIVRCYESWAEEA